MTRYFFNLREYGRTIADDEGTLLPNVDAARDRAVVSARALMSADLVEGRLCLDCDIEVVDEVGRTAVKLPFADAVHVTGL